MSKWVELLFERLIAYHGSPFLNQFAGDMGRVKQVWEQELGQFDLDTIKHALDIVKSGDEPPTLQRMISVCRQQVRSNPAPAPALPPPPPKETRTERIEQIQHLRLGSPSSNWAIVVLNEIAGGVILPRTSEQFALEALISTGRSAEIPAAYTALRRPIYINVMGDENGKH